MKIIKFNNYYKDYCQYLVFDGDEIMAVIKADSVTKTIFSISFTSDLPHLIERVMEAIKNVNF